MNNIINIITSLRYDPIIVISIIFVLTIYNFKIILYSDDNNINYFILFRTNIILFLNFLVLINTFLFIKEYSENDKIIDNLNIEINANLNYIKIYISILLFLSFIILFFNNNKLLTLIFPSSIISLYSFSKLKFDKLELGEFLINTSLLSIKKKLNNNLSNIINFSTEKINSYDQLNLIQRIEYLEKNHLKLKKNIDKVIAEKESLTLHINNSSSDLLNILNIIQKLSIIFIFVGSIGYILYKFDQLPAWILNLFNLNSSITPEEIGRNLHDHTQRIISIENSSQDILKKFVDLSKLLQENDKEIARIAIRLNEFNKDTDASFSNILELINLNKKLFLEIKNGMEGLTLRADELTEHMNTITMVLAKDPKFLEIISSLTNSGI